ncbi:hypothetical protein [Polynucleobacter sp. 39-46-10]|jgi:hypothetical protein|uniref:hypothetical protein n=1 Tax=Polynucleobacter sp. 39-46-10 TaxID=1970428 RepID=UPI000BD1FA14|nr:hypothetical protein [Polynucleobacter sp. 39-46-10]OZA77428.1 MAG: hypothetical protein B7X71_04915 [Polynucleobacter sp. 39-46-10]
MWSKNNIHSDGVGALDLFRYFLVALVTYWLINFVLSPNTLSPLHQDDYLVLGAGFENFRWSVERPVSTNLAYFMGQMGSWFSFALLNFLTAALPAMVLFFFSHLLRVRLGWVLVAAFSVMTFSHLAAFEHGKYLGLITNLTSHFFGCLALIALLHVRRTPSLSTSAIAVVAYGLSVFAKEDFLLPPLLLLAYFGVELYYPRTPIAAETVDRRIHEKQWWLKISLWFIALAAASVLSSLLVRNPFLAGAVGQVGNSAHYAVSFDPGVLLAAFLKLTIEYSPWHTMAGVLAVIALSVAWKDRRRELILLAAIVFCLILPYALIFNHLFPYRVFAWLPWLSAPVVIAAALLWRGEIAVFSSRKTAKVFASILFLVPFLIGYLDRLPRLMVAGWYASAQQSNKQMIDSIVANKALIDKEEVVGVVGVEGLSPWSNNDGAYLRKKLGFSRPWIVFVDKSTMFFTIRDSVPSTYLSVTSSQGLCEKRGLLVMKFDSFGVGVPFRAEELCTAGEVKK